MGGKKKSQKKRAPKASTPGDPTDAENIDELLAELDLPVNNPAPGKAEDSAIATLRERMRVNLRLMDPDAELRRRFGAGVVGRGPRISSARPSVRGKPSRKMRLVKAKPEWSGFENRYIDANCVGVDKYGRQQFQLTFSSSYKEATQEVEAAQRSMNPQNLANVLAKFPFHLEAIVHLAEAIRISGDPAESYALLERAVYVIDRALPLGFDLENGSSTLPYEFIENRIVHLALFRFSQAVARKGSHGSALEFTKLLLHLDPTDPMGALLVVDYYALRARDFQLLQAMANAPLDLSPPIGPAGSPARLPGILFSAILAIRREATLQGSADPPEAAAMARRAIALFPEIARALGVHVPVETSNPEVERLARIYAERTRDLWNDAAAKQLLHDACADPDTFSRETEQRSELRSEAISLFQDAALYRHVVLSELTGSGVAIPQEILRGSFDPLARQRPPPHEVRDLQGENPVSLFLRSLVPGQLFGSQPQQSTYGIGDILDLGEQNHQG